MTPQTWFITGSSRGFGRALTAAALAAGDQVIATARHPEQLADLVGRHGDRIHPVTLDVTDADAARTALHTGVDRFGRLDVIVNNAGYANLSAVEATTDEDFRRQFETNFWGLYNVSKAAIPLLRAQAGGLVIQFSSIGGRVGYTPGLGAYQAAKFAVDGLTRVLAAETAAHGIRYLTVEPGGFATDWAGSSMKLHDVPAEYQDSVGALVAMFRSGETPDGDPKRAADILVRLAKHDTIPSHLILGASAAATAIEYSHAQIAEASTWQAVSASADFDADSPVGLPAPGASTAGHAAPRANSPRAHG